MRPQKDIGDLSFYTLKKYWFNDCGWQPGDKFQGLNFVFPLDTHGYARRQGQDRPEAWAKAMNF